MHAQLRPFFPFGYIQALQYYIYTAASNKYFEQDSLSLYMSYTVDIKYHIQEHLGFD